MQANDGTPDESKQLSATCWQQAGRIRSLEDTISTLRAGACALAVENLELRLQIESLRSLRQRSRPTAASRRRPRR